MRISAPTYFTAGISLAVTASIALAPLVIPASQHTLTLPHVAMPALQLAASPADFDEFVAGIAALLTDVTADATHAVGVPGQNLIGAVDNIVAGIDDLFGGLIAGSGNETTKDSLAIVGTLSSDAFAMLAENLGRINSQLTTTTAQLGALLAGAITESVRNLSTAIGNMINDPLSAANSIGLVSAGIATGRLIVGNALTAIRSVVDAGYSIVGIALSEVTFQVNNAVSGLSALLTQLGDASGNALVSAAIDAARSLAINPALAVVNTGSAIAGTVLTAANTAVDLVLDTASTIVGTIGVTPARAAQPPAAAAVDTPTLVVPVQNTASPRLRGPSRTAGAEHRIPSPTNGFSNNEEPRAGEQSARTRDAAQHPPRARSSARDARANNSTAANG